ncbi:hypothetical protein CTI12_AA182270 [Artemisia annua]|uniref:Uncharacterized protein n=1 Tax=Artemisia annua TaxID=35608 RepID=A0A2U1P7Z7_ARTAN|nr:hypothetical protein CTI12_AA182270 [Artemisia annua]
MGLALSSSSKRVTGKLQESAEFISSIETVYNQTLSLSQQTFQGIPRYQIQSASDNLYTTLLQQPYIIPFIKKYIVTLGENQFKEFAFDLYADVIVSNAEKDIMVKVPMGVAGIVGVGVASRLGLQVVGTAAGVYAVGVATSVYLSLG